MIVLYQEALDGITYWLKILNDAEKLAGNESEGQTIYLEKIPVLIAGDDGSPIGHLVDEIGGRWCFRGAEDAS